MGAPASRALASDAAVGANRPEAGVFGLEGVAVAVVEEGVFGRAEGVFARTGV